MLCRKHVGCHWNDVGLFREDVGLYRKYTRGYVEFYLGVYPSKGNSNGSWGIWGPGSIGGTADG